MVVPKLCYAYCNTTSIILEIPGRERLEWEGMYKPKKVKIISSIRASKLVEKGFWLIWLILEMLRLKLHLLSPNLWYLKLVKCFLMICLVCVQIEIIDFYIDLKTDTRPISVPPYRKTPKRVNID